MDVDPPRLELVDPEGRVRAPGETLRLEQGQEVSFRLSDDGCGVVEREISLAPLEWQLMPDRRRFDLRGWFFLRARARDAAGRETGAWWFVRVLPAGGGG